jgi:hypothetical protein
LAAVKLRNIAPAQRFDAPSAKEMVMANPKEPRSFEDKDPTHGKDTPPYASKPGQHMMGDETEEQNLNQPGDPSQRISKEEVEQAFREGDQPGAQRP